MIIIYAVVYTFIGALMDRALCPEDDPDFVAILAWPLAVIVWIADETVKFAQRIAAKLKSKKP
jgi:hypothetical protein